MALRIVLILRKPRSGCLEGRTALIQPIVNSSQPRCFSALHFLQRFCSSVGRKSAAPSAISPVRQVEGVDRAADLVESQLAIVRSANTDAGTLDDGFRELAEPGPPMDAAFEHDIAFLQRVDAEVHQAV